MARTIQTTHLSILAIVAITAIAAITLLSTNTSTPNEDTLTNELTTITGEGVKLSRCDDYLWFCESGKKNSDRFCDIYSQYCVDSCTPSAEVCNGQDDDCDEQVDEGLSATCGSDVGVCELGYRTCSAGSWSTCTGSVNPSVETCNGLDDDCDGQTDEGGVCDQTPTNTTSSSFTFEETGSTITDESGILTGTIQGIVDRVSDGNDQALSFTGQGYVDLGSNTYLSGVTDKVTVAAWIKPNKQIAGYQGVIIHGGTDYDTFALYLYPPDEKIAFKTSGTSAHWLQESAPTIYDGKWHHIAATYDGQQKTIYVDGSPLISAVSYGDINPGTNYRLLLGSGRDETAGDLLYTGEMDDVKLFKEALTNQEVALLAQADEPICQPTTETCNGQDDDCDNQIDEGTLCNQGYTCQGTLGCVANEPDCQPTTETCNGQDDDCDNQIDEGSLCSTGYTCQGTSGCVQDDVTPPTPDDFEPFTCPAGKTCYYVSSSGNDANSGTSPSTPWKTLNKVNNHPFQPGDYVLFKRGDSWIGTLSVSRSGTSASTITYRDYGTNENKPKIYSSVPLTGWTYHENNIYKKTGITQEVGQLFVDGERMRLARTPNTGYHYIDSVPSSTRFTSNELDTSINYAGATWIGRTNHFNWYNIAVTSSSSNTLTLASAPHAGLGEGEGFFLADKYDFLDAPGEWYYDSATDTVYLRTLSNDDPDNHDVRGSIHDYGFKLEYKPYITLENLAFLHSAEDGIYIRTGDHIIINNVDIISPDLRGIHLPSITDSHYATISNNYIYQANGKGIRIDGKYANITGNIFERIGLQEEINKRVLSSIGIHIRGGYADITYNKILDTGYQAINWYGADTNIKYNFIDGACQVLSDCGGIYTYAGGSDSDYSKTSSAGSVVERNIVMNVFGNMEGYSENFATGSCIYMDDQQHDIIIRENTLRGCVNGVVLHIDGRITVEDNYVFDTAIGLLASDQRETSYFYRNLVYAFNRPTTTVWWRTTPRPQKMTKNNGASPIYNYNTYVHHYATDDQFSNSYSFEEWKAATGQDQDSTLDDTPMPTGHSEKLFYNIEKTPKTYYLNGNTYKDAYGNTVSGTSFTLQPFTSKLLIGTNLEAITTK